MAPDIIGPPLPEIISRKEAIAKGLKRYFNGKPCKYGHVAENYVRGECVVCRDRRRAAYDAANRERAAARSKKRYEADPNRARAYAAAYREIHREKVLERTAKWRSQNREYERRYRAEYWAANADRLKAGHLAWLAANPGKDASYSRNRHARKKAADGSHTAADVQRIHDAQRGKCAYCKTTLGKRYHVDHIQPLSKGGSNWPANLQILCATCNGSKHARDPIDYARTLGLLL